MMYKGLRPSLLCVPLLLLHPQIGNADTLKITSSPSGATVEIDGVVVGKTPYEMKVPGGYFHKTHSVFGERLEHPMLLRIAEEGYATKEIEMTEGPMKWVALNGTYHGDYWLLKTKHFHVELEPLSKSLTGAVVVTLAGNSKVEMRPELAVEQIVNQSRPAVVLLRGAKGQGTGFFITDTGVIATNAHVARGEESLVAVLPTGQELQAKVIDIEPDRELDVALLKVEGQVFPHLALSELATVRQGQTVVAIGNPGLGMPFTVTKGIVSAMGPIPGRARGTWIKTDAAINPGNSGGPLLNSYGEVVGINSVKVVKEDVQGIGFALSSSDLIQILHRFYPTVSAPAQSAAQTTEGTGSVTVSSEPGAAEIYVDAKFVGTTPSTLRLAVGPHEIELKAPGRQSWRRTLDVLKDSEVSLKAVLEPQR